MGRAQGTGLNGMTDTYETGRQPAESGEDFGDVLRFQLDHHHVARPTGVLDLLDREAIGIPAGFLDNGPTLPFGDVPSHQQCYIGSMPARGGALAVRR